MRKLLLDSHALIWFFENDARLPVPTRTIIEDLENEVCISIASFWEIAIKKSLSKLTLKKTIAEMFTECRNQQIEVLQISQEEIEAVETMPRHHGDPFDRIIIATCINLRFEVVSVDGQFDAYPVKRVW